MNKKTDQIVKNIPKACADENAAVRFLELQRWGSSPVCPHCGSEHVYQMKDRNGDRSKRFLWACRACTKQYTVRIGTVFEDSRIPLRHWCYAFWAACASKKGVSALQISRMTGVSYKSALFMMHRVRYAMADDPATPGPLTGIVEVDETYVGGKPKVKVEGRRRGSQYANKAPVVAMVQRNGEVRAMVMPTVNAKNLGVAISQNVHKDARLMTDEAAYYKTPGKSYASHETVNHSFGEYSRGDVTTNTVEGFFSILKRGVNGTFHSISKKHLHRYVSEFAYKYNTRKLTDGERTVLAIQKSQGKRLMYRKPIK